MAHQRQQNFCKSVKTLFPQFFKGVNVCDIGSLDINGSNHYLFEDYCYVGVDVGRGKNVNVVSKGHEYKPIDGKKYDVVISTECFEHDMFWRQTLQNIVTNLVRPNGMFLFTCATTGRPEHGTKRTSPSDSPFTSNLENDYYRNLNEEDIRQSINVDEIFSEYEFQNRLTWPQDLYFWGIKK